MLQTGANRYVMWFGEAYTGVGQMCAWSATATSPDGPFTYDQGPFCNTTQGGLIDPAAFVDADGTVYLTYSGVGSTAPRVPTRIFEVQLAPTADKPLAGTDHQLLEVLPAPNFESTNIEAPTFVRAPGGSLFLFYSAVQLVHRRLQSGRREMRFGRRPVQPRTRRQCLLHAPRCSDRVARRRSRTRRAAGSSRSTPGTPAGLATNPIDGSLRNLGILPLTFPDGNPKIG